VAQAYQSPSLVLKISEDNNKLELTTNTSRILTLDKNIPRVQVNNPELLAVTPLSATQVQISAKKAGVTQVNLWDDEGKIHTVDVLIYGDVAELDVALKTQFPNSSIRVYRYSESMVLKGFVDQPEHVSQIVQLASDYAPKVINNITVGGVQQVLLKIKVMEISRTKLRRMSTDFTFLSSSGGFFSTGVSGLLSNTTNGLGAVQTVADSAGKAAEFGIVDGNQAFFGFLDWVQQNNIAKILAEPNIVAVSGRPAQFNVGGEIPIVVPQSLGTSSIEFKKFGTQVDFLPIVLGNGNIRLEVRPRISEIDDSRSVVVQNFVIPALTVREVDTAVEMKAGQTFAVAGLVQERTESISRGLPYISDVPVIGVPFRKVEDEVNEIELLILVTPEFVDAIEPHEVPCGGPGYATTSPSNNDLYCGGVLEVPAYCNPIRGMTACGECGGAGGYGGGCDCGSSSGGMITDGVTMPGGTGYDDSYAPEPMDDGFNGQEVSPDVMRLPPMESDEETLPLGPSAQRVQPAAEIRQAARPGTAPHFTVPRPYNPPRVPVYMRNASRPNNQTAAPDAGEATGQIDGLFGPVGYDPQ
jgi:pilus assembly protein CpaC